MTLAELSGVAMTEPHQCSKCGDAAEFGYRVQGAMQGFCAEHRLSQNYADARLPVADTADTVLPASQITDELKDELAARAEHIRGVWTGATKHLVEHIVIIGQNLVEARAV